MFTLTNEEKMKLIEKYKGRSLKDLRPDLAAEWHPTKNGDLTPEMVTPGSKKKAWWHLPYDDPKTGKHFDFEWEALLRTRVRGVGCPFLSGHAVLKGFNDLATVNPELAAEWHPTKNGDLTPEMVTSGSEKKVWWLLHYIDPQTGRRENFEWAALVYSRTNGCKCPFLRRRTVSKGTNDLATTYPELAAEWHPTKNGSLTPDMVSASSRKKVWWYLPYIEPQTGRRFNFEWEAAITKRAFRGSNCPFLSGQAVWSGYNDLATTHPKIAAEWHPDKNGELTPEMVTHGTLQKFWWRCNKGHEWLTSVGVRSSGSGCPCCRKSRGEKKVADFLDKYNIPFKEQHTFEDCRSDFNKPLRFDHAVFDNNSSLVCLVEYDGEQHFKPVDFSGKNNGKEKLLVTQSRDKMKNEYCRANKIPLVRIPYWDYDNIDQILLKKMVRYGLLQ